MWGHNRENRGHQHQHHRHSHSIKIDYQVEDPASHERRDPQSSKTPAAKTHSIAAIIGRLIPAMIVGVLAVDFVMFVGMFAIEIAM